MGIILRYSYFLGLLAIFFSAIFKLQHFQFDILLHFMGVAMHVFFISLVLLEVISARMGGFKKTICFLLYLFIPIYILLAIDNFLLVALMLLIGLTYIYWLRKYFLPKLRYLRHIKFDSI